MSNVVPFPIRSDDIEPEVAPPVLVGPSSRRLVFENAYLRVYEEPPRNRSICLTGWLGTERWITLKFPWVVYAVNSTATGYVDEMYVFFRPGPLQDETGKLFKSFLPNVGKDSARVCFGNLAEAVEDGEIDPIDAFWMSSFRPENGFSDWPGPESWQDYSNTLQGINADKIDALTKTKGVLKKVMYGSVRRLNRAIIFLDVLILFAVLLFSTIFFTGFATIVLNVGFRAWLIGFVVMAALTLSANECGRRLLMALFRGFKLKKVNS